VLRNPAYCGARPLRERGGLVAPLLNVAPELRFRRSLLGRPSHFGLVRLATAGFFSSLLDNRAAVRYPVGRLARWGGVDLAPEGARRARRAAGVAWRWVVGMGTAERGKVIRVDFGARRRYDDDVPCVGALLPEPQSAIREGEDFLVFARPPGRGGRAQYLGGRWNRGWMLFVWTRDDLVEEGWRMQVESRGYVPQHLDRDGFRELVTRSAEVGGLIVNGDIDADLRTIRAAAEQFTRRAEVLRLLRS